MQTYVMPWNVIVFLGAFWTALIYGISTHDWLGMGVWLTLGFAALTSERLTPPRFDANVEN